MKKMRTAYLIEPERMELKDVQVPECEAAGILVKVEACGICGGDVRNYKQGLRADVGPQIMGHEIVGIVEKTGEEVTGFSAGDRVALAPDVSCGKCYYCKRGLVNLCTNHRMIGTHWPGGFAQYVYLSGEIIANGFIEHIPENISFEDAAMAEPSASVIACQQRAGIQPGDTVVVIGDGPIGCLHIEVAKARGASKTILIGKHRLEIAKRFEPNHIIATQERGDVKEVMRLTEDLGADFVICANANAATQKVAVEMCRKRGTVILFGGVPKANPMTSLDSNLIHYNEISVVGAFSYPSTGIEMALRYIQDGKIDARKYITKQVSLENIVEGIQAASRGEALKVLVRPWSEKVD